ncbi:MAG TPA: hypothetical protein V6D07_19145 [Trichocoleus sp.]
MSYLTPARNESTARRLARRYVADTIINYAQGVDTLDQLSPKDLATLLRLRRLSDPFFDAAKEGNFRAWIAEAKLAIRYLGKMQAGAPANQFESWSMEQFGKPDPVKKRQKLEAATGQLVLI